jgi:sugar transferase (PEP-CTERM/EpsH1 system associated)
LQREPEQREISTKSDEVAVRILFLTHRLPYAANKGDRIRALHLLRALAPHAQVDLVSLVHDADEASHAADLEPLASSVTVAPVSRLRGYVRAAAALGTRKPLTHALLDAPSLRDSIRRIVQQRRPDLILAYCSGMARFALEAPLDSIPLVVDLVDVDSEKWKSLSRTARMPRRWVYAREARLLAAFEGLAARSARSVLVVNEKERASLLRLEPLADVRVVPNGVALDEFRPTAPPSDEPLVTFCGVMNYRPNEEGAVWLARLVWPAVRARCPNARLVLLGSNPTPAVVRLAAADPSIDVTGMVPDVRPYLWRTAVSVAPLFMARGVQNKVLEAVAAGLPSVVTPAVHEGLPAEILPACVSASDPDAFAQAIVQLLNRTSSERRAMAAAANVTALSWKHQLSALRGILDAAAGGIAIAS